MSTDNKLVGFLRNHWVYIIGLIVSGIVAWTQLNAQVKINTRDIEEIKPQMKFYSECVIEQKSLNRLIKA